MNRRQFAAAVGAALLSLRLALTPEDNKAAIWLDPKPRARILRGRLEALTIRNGAEEWTEIQPIRPGDYQLALADGETLHYRIEAEGFRIRAP